LNRPAFIYASLALAAVLAYGLLDPEHYPFPKCPFYSLTGWLCPGCGSQRAIHQVLHGHFASAFHLNALFLPAMVYALSGYVSAFFLPARWASIRSKWYGIPAAWISLAVILIFWIGRNLLHA
jgi:Protein of unknown function (DUF2752)